MKKRKQALIIEDRSNWSDLYQHSLQRLGFLVKVAKAYADALGLLQHEPFAVAIVDLNLASEHEPANLYGVRLLESLVTKKIPFVIVSGHAMPELVDVVYKYYPSTYILDKSSFDPKTFEANVESICKTSFYDKHSTSKQKRQKIFNELRNLTSDIVQPGLKRPVKRKPRRLNSTKNNDKASETPGISINAKGDVNIGGDLVGRNKMTNKSKNLTL